VQNAFDTYFSSVMIDDVKDDERMNVVRAEIIPKFRSLAPGFREFFKQFDYFCELSDESPEAAWVTFFIPISNAVEVCVGFATSLDYVKSVVQR